MTCGVALLVEWYRRSLGPGLSIERSRDKGLGSDVDMRDATRTSCCVSRSGRAQPGSAGHIEDSAVPGTMTFVPSTISFHQKGASMSTDVVDRIESSIYIKQGTLPPADFHHPCPARSDPVGFGNPDQTRPKRASRCSHRPLFIAREAAHQRAGMRP